MNLRRKGKKHYNYFDAFVSCVDYSCKAAYMLQDILINFNADELETKMKEMHEIEHAADIEKHVMMNHLLKEFITPIEREDISHIAQEIDSVTDNIEDVLMRLYMFNVKAIRPEALEFAQVIVDCCDALKVAMEDFANFRKSTTVRDKIIHINNLEEDGDRIYTRAVRNLHVNSQNPIEISVWDQVFDYLERCCDAVEEVADLMEAVIMKNT